MSCQIEPFFKARYNHSIKEVYVRILDVTLLSSLCVSHMVLGASLNPFGLETPSTGYALGLQRTNPFTCDSSFLDMSSSIGALSHKVTTPVTMRLLPFCMGDTIEIAYLTTPKEQRYLQLGIQEIDVQQLAGVFRARVPYENMPFSYKTAEFALSEYYNATFKGSAGLNLGYIEEQENDKTKRDGFISLSLIFFPIDPLAFWYTSPQFYFRDKKEQVHQGGLVWSFLQIPLDLAVSTVYIRKEHIRYGTSARLMLSNFLELGASYAYHSIDQTQHGGAIIATAYGGCRIAYAAQMAFKNKQTLEQSLSLSCNVQQMSQQPSNNEERYTHE